jgi:hypothetical protein
MPQGQPGDINMRSSREAEPEAHCTINAPPKGFASQFQDLFFDKLNCTYGSDLAFLGHMHFI